VRGQFEDYAGTFLFDPANLAQSKFDIDVKVKSVNTNNRKRDNHLRSDDFLSAGEYPVMTFRSTRIQALEGRRYSVEGKLTIKDVTKDVVVPFVFYGIKDNPFDKEQAVAGFEASFTIDRLEYHVGSGKFYEMGVVGKDVTITVSLEMIRKK
jgi:polyisoprenoid-binding protein YceI